MRISDWSSDVCSSDLAHGCPEFAGEESFQAADDLGLRLSFGDAAGDVSLGGLVVLHANDDDAVERGVCLSVTAARSEEHTSELQSLMRTAYAVFCLKKTKQTMSRQVNSIERKRE